MARPTPSAPSPGPASRPVCRPARGPAALHHAAGRRVGGWAGRRDAARGERQVAGSISCIRLDVSGLLTSLSTAGQVCRASFGSQRRAASHVTDRPSTREGGEGPISSQTQASCALRCKLAYTPTPHPASASASCSPSTPRSAPISESISPHVADGCIDRQKAIVTRELLLTLVAASTAALASSSSFAQPSCPF